jgi:hypothetical protein
VLKIDFGSERRNVRKKGEGEDEEERRTPAPRAAIGWWLVPQRAVSRTCIRPPHLVPEIHERHTVILHTLGANRLDARISLQVSVPYTSYVHHFDLPLLLLQDLPPSLP